MAAEHISTFREVEFVPGTTRRFWYQVGQTWFGPMPMPLIVITGTMPGPKMVTLAGQHGDEGYGVLGLLDLANDLNPSTLHGQLWIVPCANVFGYSVSHRNSPYDQQDMNRVHPGNEAGTITEQVAHWLHSVVFTGADLVVDLHGGSPENGDSAFAMWSDAHDKPSILPLVASLDLHFLIGAHKQMPGMLSQALEGQGIPQISIEAGSTIHYARENSAQIKGYVLACLRFLNMLPGQPAVAKPLQLMQMVTHRAKCGGTFKTLVSFGQEVHAGEHIGVIMDLLGNVVQEINALEGGIVAVMRTGVRVHPGETVLTLAVATGELAT
jgi:predicted deacylase